VTVSAVTGREGELVGITGFIWPTIMRKRGNVDDNMNAINRLNRKKMNAILILAPMTPERRKS
jgi:hypothetical protein